MVKYFLGHLDARQEKRNLKLKHPPTTNFLDYLTVSLHYWLVLNAKQGGVSEEAEDEQSHNFPRGSCKRQFVL